MPDTCCLGAACGSGSRLRVILDQFVNFVTGKAE